MSMRVDGIQSEEELKKAQIASQAAGGSIPNYHDWANVLSDLELAGVESTGSYEGDVALRQEIERNVDEFLAEAQEAQRAQEAQKYDGTQRMT